MSDTRDRNVILAALMDHVVARVPGIVTHGRRVKFWTDVPPAAQPALFLRHTADLDNAQWGALPLNQIEAEFWLYCRSPEGDDNPPDADLNALMTKLRAAFAPDDLDREVFTLGGLVWWCGIDGRTEFDPGDIDNQSKAVIPIKILIPA